MLPFGYFDLIETFPKRGCAVCNLLAHDVDHLLDSILYEHVTDPEMHAAFRASKGLCHTHGWRLSTLGNVLSMAILYEATLDEILNTLDQVPSSAKRYLNRLMPMQNNNADLVEALSPSEPCIACKLEKRSETQYLSVLSDYIHDEKMQAAYQQSDGLCLDHFKQILRYTHHAERTQKIIDIQREIWKRLDFELQEFKRKYDQHVGEKIGSEGDSWLRAIASISGGKK